MGVTVGVGVRVGVGVFEGVGVMVAVGVLVGGRVVLAVGVSSPVSGSVEVEMWATFPAVAGRMIRMPNNVPVENPIIPIKIIRPLKANTRAMILELRFIDLIQVE